VSKKILVAYDGSRGSEKTIDVAASLAGGNGSEVWLLCAYSYENVPPAFRSFAEAEGVNDPAEHLYYRYLVDHVMTPARERLKKAGVAKVEVALQQGDPAEHLYYRYLVDHVMTPARERLKKAGVAKVEVALQQGDAAEVIVDFAKEKVVDTIVIGSRGLSDLEGLVFGSVSHKVNHNAPCTCVTVR